MEELKEYGVARVRRFMKRIDGQLCPTPSVLLFFDRENNPQYVTMLFQNHKVETYNEPVIRCYKCQLFGHTQSQCKGYTKCVRCGGRHTFEECPNKDQPKCFRCGEKHSAAFQGCKCFRKAKEIMTFKNENKLSYAQAAAKLKNTKLNIHARFKGRPQIHREASRRISLQRWLPTYKC